MTSGEWTCLISFATAPFNCSERGGSEKFKMKIYVSSGIRTHTPPVHDRKVAAPYHLSYKALYISTCSIALSITAENDEMVLWYRGILCNRARNVEGCPKGNLKTRKSTKSGQAIQKYATDCYGINLFLNGDPSKIEEIFDGKTSMNTPRALSTKLESVEIRVLVQSLVNCVNSLEQAVKAKDTLISSLKTELKDLTTQHKGLKDHVTKLEGEITPKLVNLEPFRKQSQTQLNSVECFDYEIYLKNKETMENKIKQISSVCSSLKKNQQNNAASYAAIVRTPPRPPHSPAQSTQLETGDMERNVASPVYSDQSNQSASTRDISIIEEISDTDITDREDPVRDSVDSHDYVELRFSKSRKDVDTILNTLNIPVIHRNHSKNTNSLVLHTNAGLDSIYGGSAANQQGKVSSIIWTNKVSK